MISLQALGTACTVPKLWPDTCVEDAFSTKRLLPLQPSRVQPGCLHFRMPGTMSVHRLDILTGGMNRPHSSMVKTACIRRHAESRLADFQGVCLTAARAVRDFCRKLVTKASSFECVGRGGGATGGTTLRPDAGPANVFSVCRSSPTPPSSSSSLMMKKPSSAVHVVGVAGGWIGAGGGALG